MSIGLRGWFAISLALLLVLPGSAAAGFIIHEQDYASDEPEFKSTSISIIQKNVMKFQEEDDIIYYLWNLGNGEVAQVNTAAKVYTAGTLDQELAEMKKYMAKMQADMAEEMKQAGEEPPPPPKPKEKKPVNITKTSEEAVIAGYKAVKYDVREGDRLVEEVWISKDLNVGSDLDYKKFKKMFQQWMNALSEAMAEFEGGDIGQSWTERDEYIKLFEEGYAVKQVVHLEEGSFITEVTSVEKKDVPDSEFALPKEFRKVSAQEFMEAEEE